MKRVRTRAYPAAMHPRRLLALLVAFGMLFAPALAADASGAPSRPMQMMSGACDMPAHKAGHDGKTETKGCCVSAYSALAAEPSAAADPPMRKEQRGIRPSPVRYRGTRPSIAQSRCDHETESVRRAASGAPHAPRLER